MSKDAYGLDPTFETVIATMCASRPRFFGRIGYAVDPECLSDDSAKLVMQACQAINKDLGHGPDSTIIVVQRLRSWMSKGRVTIERIREAVDMFDDAEDAGLPSEEAVVVELKPVLQQAMRKEAVRVAIDHHGKQRDLGRVVELEKRATTLGEVDTSIGVIVGDASFDDIDALSKLQRLPSAILELDAELDGGLQRAGLGVVIGASGDGKSMFLSHQAGVSTMQGHFVLYATLELPRPIVQARIIANMTGIPINALLADKPLREKAKQMLRDQADRVGMCIVQEFPPQATTVDDVIRWMNECEQFTGQQCTVLITDYGDKFKAPGKKDTSLYDTGRIVFEALRGIADQRKIWSWTGCQGTRQKKNKILDLNDAADSMHKIRVADLVVTLNCDGEDEMKFHIAKHRTGRSKRTVGPLPTEFEVGRIAPILLDENGMVAI